VAEGRIEVITLLLLAGVQEKLGVDLVMFTFKHAPASCGFPVIVTLMHRMFRYLPGELSMLDFMDVIDTFRNDPDGEPEMEKISAFDRFLEGVNLPQYRI
jgi:hypothetical protein